MWDSPEQTRHLVCLHLLGLSRPVLRSFVPDCVEDPFVDVRLTSTTGLTILLPTGTDQRRSNRVPGSTVLVQPLTLPPEGSTDNTCTLDWLSCTELALRSFLPNPVH